MPIMRSEDSRKQVKEANKMIALRTFSIKRGLIWAARLAYLPLIGAIQRE